MLSTITEALNAIDLFESSTIDTSWKLDRLTVADRLRKIIQDPLLINQGSINVCGPAATFVLWCKNDPLAYAQYTINLFETGEAKIGSISVKPGSDLINQDYGVVALRMNNNPCPQAEWMAMSALRDSSNAVLDFEGTPEEDVSGITTPSEITDWLTATDSYSSVLNEGNFVVNAGLDHAQKLQPSLQEDVIILINANMLPQSVNSPFLDLSRFFPNHFIILLSSINVNGSSVRFSCWTWGKSFLDLVIDKDKFEDNYFGAVIATF
jgi:hypothetical protein